MNEGYIKFQFKQVSENCPSLFEVLDLINLRNELFNLGLIGFVDKISFGNVSKKLTKNSFIITASNTGNIKTIQPEHLVTILSVDLNLNLVRYSGKLPPSSETLTHYSVYQSFDFAKLAAHFHHSLVWEKLKKFVPTTPETSEYGTVELANSILEISKTFPFKENYGVICLGGHRDGILVFGADQKDILKWIKTQVSTLV